MLPDYLKKTLVERREVIARSILALNTDRRMRSSTEERMGTYLRELGEIENALKNGTPTFDTAQSVAENLAYRAAFLDWLRNGSQLSERSKIDLQKYETRATMASEGTPTGAAYPGSTVGFFVPMSFWAEVVSAAKSVGPFWDDDFCSIHITPKGNPLPIPNDDDVTTAAVLTAENGIFSNQALTISQNVLGSYKYVTSVLVSNEMAEDSGIPLDSYLARRFGIRCMRGLLAPLTNGATGGANPVGVLTGLTASLTAAGASRNDGSSAANTIGSDDVAALELALDPAYRANAKFMAHQNTIAALRKVCDKQGHPVFPGLQQGDKPTLLNYEVVPNPAMDTLQTSASSPAVTKVPLAFGDFSRFHVRLVHPVLMRKTERYADFAQTLFALMYRVDSVLVDPTAGSVPPVVTLQTTC